jgi:hypothetical protein
MYELLPNRRMRATLYNTLRHLLSTAVNVIEAQHCTPPTLRYCARHSAKPLTLLLHALLLFANNS